MPHATAERRRVVTRPRRIKGQAEAMERAFEAGTDCGELLQQAAALRGAWADGRRV
jgi:DNA-binding FrmR family transcriptional regulator